MKKVLISITMVITTVQGFTQISPIANNKSAAVEPMGEIMLPILFMAFLVFMLVTLIKYFLEFRLKNKLIDKGMSEQLSTYLLNKDVNEKQSEVVKWAILFCGIGTGLIITYLTAPIHIHSLAIMAFSIGLSYLAYFFYLRK